MDKIIVGTKVVLKSDFNVGIGSNFSSNLHSLGVKAGTVGVVARIHECRSEVFTRPDRHFVNFELCAGLVVTLDLLRDSFEIVK
jgi:hypothetical protein